MLKITYIVGCISLYINNFQLTVGDNNIGTVYLPNKDSKNLPVIIYCHGWGGNRQLWLPIEKLCELAIEKNFALVTFDFFGCGDYSEMTYSRWKSNLSDIISWVIEQPFTNVNKVGCYAFSSGSTAALRLAAEDDRIAFIVSVGTCISTHFNMVNGGPAKIFADNYQKLISGGKEPLFGIDFGIKFFLDTISNAPIHIMKTIKCPTLFIQGLADNPFRCADAKMAYQLMKNENNPASYIEIANGTHGLENVINEALNHMFNWLSSVI